MKPVPTLCELIPLVIESKRANGRRENYLTALRSCLAQFARGRDHVPISDITVADIDSWLRRPGQSPASINSNIGKLSSIFVYAWRNFYIPEVLTRRIEKAYIDPKDPKILTADQCRAAIDFTLAENPQMLAWLVLTLFIGLRPIAEADRLSWDNVDLVRNRIIIDADKTKTRCRRIIDLNLIPGAAAWLDYARELHCELQKSHSTRRRFIRSLRNHLGIVHWPQDVLRHTAASNLFALHQDAAKVAVILGNSPTMLFRHYRALVFREDADKFYQILPPKLPVPSLVEQIRAWFAVNPATPLSRPRCQRGGREIL